MHLLLVPKPVIRSESSTATSRSWRGAGLEGTVHPRPGAARLGPVAPASEESSGNGVWGSLLRVTRSDGECAPAVSLDEQRRIVDVNESFTRLARYRSPHDLLWLPFDSIVTSRVTCEGREWQLVRRAGGVIHVQLLSTQTKTGRQQMVLHEATSRSMERIGRLVEHASDLLRELVLRKGSYTYCYASPSHVSVLGRDPAYYTALLRCVL